MYNVVKTVTSTQKHMPAKNNPRSLSISGELPDHMLNLLSNVSSMTRHFSSLSFNDADMFHIPSFNKENNSLAVHVNMKNTSAILMTVVHKTCQLLWQRLNSCIFMPHLRITSHPSKLALKMNTWPENLFCLNLFLLIVCLLFCGKCDSHASSIFETESRSLPSIRNFWIWNQMNGCRPLKYTLYKAWQCINSTLLASVGIINTRLT